MANYQKTQELFNGEPNREPGLRYEKSGEQLAEEKWFEQVKNPNTCEFFQLEDLRALGAVPGVLRIIWKGAISDNKQTIQTIFQYHLIR
jgi:hypothetical protein